MEINGSKRISDINVPAFKGEKKETSAPQEKKAEASASDALNAYGRAMVNQPKKTQKEIFLQLVDEALKNYEEKLDCDEKRKQQFIKYLRETLDIEIKDCIENVTLEEIDKMCKTYLFSGYKEDDMQLVNQLFEEKNEAGDFRFDGESIVNILSSVTAENRDILSELMNPIDGEFRFDGNSISNILYYVDLKNKYSLTELINAKDIDGNFRFGESDISLIIKRVTPENKDLLSILVNARYDKDNFRFDSSDICSILEQNTPENRKIFLYLINEKDIDGNFRFSGSQIFSILESVTPENKDLLPILINVRDTDDDFRLDGYNIASILESVTPENRCVLEQLINTQDEHGKFRFYNWEISTVLHSVTSKNIDLLEILINAKDSDDNFRFNERDISLLLNNITPEKKDILLDLINAKDTDGSFRFDKKDISLFLDNTTPENKEILKTLIKDNSKDSHGNFRFDKYNISEILCEVTPENKELLKLMIKDNSKNRYDDFRFNSKDICFILKCITPENKELLELMIKDNSKNRYDDFRFNINDIFVIQSEVTPENKELLELLIKDDSKDIYGNFRFNINTISEIQCEVTPENKGIFELLMNSKNINGNFRFNGNEISLILKQVTPEKTDILQSLLDEKYNNGNFRFNGDDISSILKQVTPEKSDILKSLIDAKDNNGDIRFPSVSISGILSNVTTGNSDILETLINQKENDGELRFDRYDIYSIISAITPENENNLRNMLKNYDKLELTPNYIVIILNPQFNTSLHDIKNIENIIGKSTIRNLSRYELQLICQFKGFLNKQNINEVSQSQKKELVRNLVANNTGVFNISDELRKYMPLLPKNQEEYCELLPTLVKSLGIETNELSESEISEVEKEITSLSGTLKTMSDKDFEILKIEQEYTTEEFIKDTYQTVKGLPKEERQKVYDYFGFELKTNEFGTAVDDSGTKKLSITGYPVNLNNGKKLAQIDSAETKAVVEQLRPYVIKYSENNQVKSNNKEVENILNEIMEKFPELRNEIGKTQHETHDYDLLKHSLKVMQKISQNPEYEKLNKTDKKLILLASLFHDITKPIGLRDKTHPRESAFDTYYILKKMKLPKQEEIKLYTLINSHEWLAYVNNERIKGTKEAEKRMQSVAFDLQYDNLFEMSKIFTVADLKAVKKDDSFYKDYKEDYNNAEEKISKNIAELKTTQPIMPVTPIPKADRIEEAITQVNADGSTNIKGVYKNKEGLVIIKYNEVENEDWEKIGFPKGSISRGIDAKGLSSQHGQLESTEEVNTGNIKFFVHGLDYSNQLSKFDAFALPDSDALLSVSYAERPESKYRFFRTQGVLLNTPTKYMHGGGETDSGSGCAKNLDLFKKDYIFGGHRESDRKYISNLIKEALDMSDEEYLEFVKENADKPFTSIEPEEVRNTIIKAFSTINSNTRRGNRAYNEMYITNPEVMGVFAYPADDNVGSIMGFMDKQPEFLKEYALENNLPFVVFGN